MNMTSGILRAGRYALLNRTAFAAALMSLSGAAHAQATGPAPQAGDNDADTETEIIVNARPREVPGHTVTFEQIVQIAFPGPQPPNTVFSMTYRNAASKPHAGELGPGQQHCANRTRRAAPRTSSGTLSRLRRGSSSELTIVRAA